MVIGSLQGKTNLKSGEYALEVVRFQERYSLLVDLLARYCTQVEVVRVLEHDSMIKPHDFIRDAVHTFIFPPQSEVQLEVQPDAGEVEGTAPDTLVREHTLALYDAVPVTGFMTVRYNDSGPTPSISVEEAFIYAVIPEEIEVACAVVLEP